MNNLNLMKFALFLILYFSFVFLIQSNASKSKVGKQKNIGADEKILIPSKRIPLKSNKAPDGDIIDCIYISQQPAFDHPLLRNHTILTGPSYYPEGILSPAVINQVIQPWSLKGSCPEETIPIRRTKTEEDLSSCRKKHPRSFSRSSSVNAEEPDGNGGGMNVHAVAYVRDNKYHGTKASINVWQPLVENHGEFSLAQIWVLGGPSSEINTIEVGWHVLPDLYEGDNKTRLFIFWTKDGYHGSSGCYNLLCPGFVQTSDKVVLGGTISPVSSYYGPQYAISLAVWKDSKQDAWWLFCDDIAVGYWPGSLFTYLKDSASGIQWGGEVIGSKPNGQHTTTPMGSGHFAEERFGGASYFRNLQVIDESDNFSPPGSGTMIDQPASCYNIHFHNNDVLGNHFFYGGPGRNPNCP